MRITTQDFLDNYITAPWSQELSLSEKIFAAVLSALLFLPTLGAFHWRSLYLKSKNITQISISEMHNERTNRFKKIAASIDKVSFKILGPGESTVPFTIKDVPRIINEHFIKQYYSKNLPSEEEVTVPFVDLVSGQKSWRKWHDLTREEKIRVNNTGTHEHDRLSEWEPESAANRRFFGHGQQPFLEGDPRLFHGNDHCVRAAIGSCISGYFYQKFHPHMELSTQDITFNLVVAAGHDCGRQTEGPDVYDEMSAKLTIEILKKLGVADKQRLHDAKEAIVNKDSDPINSKKCATAKCVQNADCAEYARLLLQSSPRQDPDGFEKSRNYLDIFKELQVLATQKNQDKPEDVVLKNGLTYGDFCFELDAVRTELNDFIFRTHKRDFRQQLLLSGENPFEAILSVINPTEFPLLHSILLKVGLKEPVPTVTEAQNKQKLKEITTWLHLGIEKISTESLRNMSATLKSISQPQTTQLKNQIATELHIRTLREEEFLNAREIPALIKAYATLQPIMKREYYSDFINRLPNGIEDITHNTEKGDSYAKICLLEVEEKALQQELQQIQQLSRTASVIVEKVDVLKKKAVELLNHYHDSNDLLRRPEIQTTCALAFEEAAHLYLKLGLKNEAKITLQLAATSLQIEKTNPLNTPKRLLTKLSGNCYRYILTDCGFVRKRKLGLIEKKINNQPYLEMSLELPPIMRQKLEEVLKELIPDPQKSVVPARYYKRVQNEYLSEPIVAMKEDLKIKIAEGIEIQVGNNPQYWTQYHLMRIRIEPHISMQELHKALATIGLPTILMPSRKEDIENEMMARSIAFRFPSIYYKDLPVRKAPDEIYQSLSDQQKLIVDRDIKNAKLTLVGNNHFEMVQPTIAEEAWDKGVRGLGHFLSPHKTFEGAAETMAKIIQNGLFSSQERYQHGIGGGCVPDHNYQTGSGNQVFARILTTNLFEQHFDVGKFALRGQIFVLMKPQVLERMPYSYLKDRGGLRNPHFYMPKFTPEGQPAELHFSGAQKIKERLGFTEHVETLKTGYFPTTESMFDLNVGSQYIDKLMVWTESDRHTLIATLQKTGIYELGGVPIEEVVVVGTTLTPELIRNYYDTNPYKEEREHGTRYI